MLGELLTTDSRISGTLIDTITASLYNPVVWVAVAALFLVVVFMGRLR